MRVVKPGVGLVLLIVLVGGTLSVLSVMRYVSYNATMEDLGNMSQAIWSVTQGRPLEYTPSDGSIPRFSRLGWHAELIYYPIALIYALAPTPVTLLIMQAVWFALGAIPAYAMAEKRIGDPWAALAVAASYLFYPVAQAAVLWDFHGDTLAMPTLLFALWALERGRVRAYVLWILLALSCKVYVFFPVALLGIVLTMRGRRAIGITTIAAAALWAGFCLFVLRPHFASGETSDALSNLRDYLTFYFSLSPEMRASLLPRLVVATIVFLPLLPVAWRDMTWTLPALGVALPVLLSNGPGPSYHYVYHHYALVVPFLVMAIVVGVAALKERRTGGVQRFVPGSPRLLWWPLGLGVTVLLVLVLNSLLLNTPLSRIFWEAGFGGEMAYRPTPRDRMKDQWLAANVPQDVPLAASVTLAPHLANRVVLFTSYNLAGNLDYVACGVFDGLFDKVIGDGEDFVGGALYDMRAIRLLLQDPGFALAAEKDGLLLFLPVTQVPDPLDQKVQCVHPSEVVITRDFGEGISLVSSNVEVIGRGRLRLRFGWMAVRPLIGRAPLFAVSRIEGIPLSRIVHLPTVAILPSTDWPEDCVVQEVFEAQVPDDLPPGEYRILTGWYDSGVAEAYATSASSRLGDELVTDSIQIPIEW